MCIRDRGESEQIALLDEKINEFKNQVTQLSGFVAELNESNSFDDIENILEEISEVNSRTLYLLSLS